jgi:hypothetical protein
MPSRKPKAPSRRVPSSSVKVSTTHVAFFPLLFLVLIVWVVYRTLFRFPIWFDETIGKAIFFGLPVWLYISLTRSHSMTNTFAPDKIKRGLLIGLALGGVFGFAGTLATLINRQVVIQAAPLFSSDAFWWEFFLALMTGFWESLFFYTWVMVITMEKFSKWSVLNQILLVAGVFLAFHLPNIFLQFPLSQSFGYMFLLFFFGLGQAFVFLRYRNLYALTLSQAIWGMVLLVHTR